MSNAFRAAEKSRRNILARLTLCLAIGLFIALAPQAAKAGDAETAEVAVEIFVKGAQISGLPLSDQEAAIVKQIVTCGLAGTSVADCARNVAVATVLKQAGINNNDVSSAANCLLSGTRASTCLTNTIVAQLPAQAQPMASCVISGQGNVADCTRKFAEAVILDKVPADFRPVAQCMINTQDAKKCGTDFVVQKVASSLPPEIRDQATAIVNCLGSAPQAANCVASAAAPDEIKPLVACATRPGANVGQCAAEFATQNLPAGTPGVAKDLVGCLADPAGFTKCAEQKGIANARDMANSQLSEASKKAIDAALKTIEKLKPDAPMANLDAGISRDNIATVKNIMAVAQGIKEGNWPKVVFGAGQELAIVASNIILSFFLTPAVASALGPAVAAMIHNDAAAIQMALKEIANGNPVGLAQVIFKWYETAFIDKPCALLGDSDAKEKICGGLSDAINIIAEAGGDLAKKILGLGKDALEWLGVWGLADDLATGVWNVLKDAVNTVGKFIGLGDDDDDFKPRNDCGSPADYYANNYLSCLPKATDAASGGNLDTGALDSACNAHFNRCVVPKNRGSVAQACGAMSASLRNLSQQVSGGMQSAADVYTSMGGPAAFAEQVYQDLPKNLGDAEDMCKPSFWSDWQQQYATKCAAFVESRFPPKRGAAGPPNSCAVPLAANTYASRKACLNSLNANAAKASLAGPNGDYCKKARDRQAAEIAASPCKIVRAGAPIPIPGHSKPLEDIRLDCGESYRQIPSGRVPADGLITPRTSFIDLLKLRPGGILFPPVNVGLPRLTSSVNPYLVIPASLNPAYRVPVSTPTKPPVKLAPAPVIRPARPVVMPSAPKGGPIAIRPPMSRPPAVFNPPNGQQPGGGRPSAMDIAGQAANEGRLSGVAGSAGGAALGVRPTPRDAATTGGYGSRYVPPPKVEQAAAPKGPGSGGSNLVNSQSGNAPAGHGGSNMVNSKSGNAPTGTRFTPVTKLRVRPSAIDTNFDYGGCSGCNSRRDDLRVR